MHTYVLGFYSLSLTLILSVACRSAPSTDPCEWHENAYGCPGFDPCKIPGFETAAACVEETSCDWDEYKGQVACLTEDLCSHGAYKDVPSCVEAACIADMPHSAERPECRTKERLIERDIASMSGMTGLCAENADFLAILDAFPPGTFIVHPLRVGWDCAKTGYLSPLQLGCVTLAHMQAYDTDVGCSSCFAIPTAKAIEACSAVCNLYVDIATPDEANEVACGRCLTDALVDYSSDVAACAVGHDPCASVDCGDELCNGFTGTCYAADP